MSNLQVLQNHRAKTVHRLTTAFIERAQEIERALVQLNTSFDALEETALKLRCGFGDGKPSEKDVRHMVANEIARVLGVAGTSLFGAIDIDTLVSPDKAPHLVATVCNIGAALATALSKKFDEENKAEDARNHAEALRQLSAAN
jgi:hypothetical protein